VDSVHVITTQEIKKMNDVDKAGSLFKKLLKKGNYEKCEKCGYDGLELKYTRYHSRVNGKTFVDVEYAQNICKRCGYRSDVEVGSDV